MDIIKMTRELAKAVIADEIYVKYKTAKAGVDEDGVLGAKLRELEDVRALYYSAQEGDEPDPAAAHAAEARFGELYEDIMLDEKMKAYNFARSELDELMSRVVGILNMSVNGADPDTCEPDLVPGGCSGECGGCGGCG